LLAVECPIEKEADFNEIFVVRGSCQVSVAVKSAARLLVAVTFVPAFILPTITYGLETDMN
jgi:hypothetical protein